MTADCTLSRKGATRRERLVCLDASQLLEYRLKQIPSIFGRLVCLGKDGSLTSLLPRSISKGAIREVQRRLFREWLNLNLRSKESDLRPYIETPGANICSIETQRLMIRLCRDIVPRNASPNEMQLFIGSVETVLQSLASELT